MFNVSDAMERLEYVEGRITEIYRWWSATTPGVTAKEVGELGSLWGEFDRLAPVVDGAQPHQ